MAFTKTPEVSTFKTQRFPLFGAPLQRDGLTKDKDRRMLNCFVETMQTAPNQTKKYFVKKRGGLEVSTPTVIGRGRGAIYDSTFEAAYFVVENSLYIWQPQFNNLVSPIATLLNSPRPVGLTLHEAGGVPYVVVLDGTNGWLVNAQTFVATQITDVDFPTPHVPAPVSLDGYLFVAKEGTADIYNSDLDDPFSWTPGNFITAEMFPDTIVTLTKNNNYVYAVGQASMEYFYDAANATGSPLARNDSAVQQFGSEAAFSVVQTEKEVVLIGSTENGGRTVWLVEGFTATEIGTEPVKQSLDAQFDQVENATAFCIRSMGHKFYVLRLSDRTWVYDFEEKLWHEWSSFNTDTGGEVAFFGVFACDSAYGYPFILHVNNGVLYTMKQNVYNDSDRQITMQVTTDKIDFDTLNRKDIYRFVLFGDWPLNAGSALITLHWSDDDYRTWVGNRSIQLATGLPVTRRLGKFRRRAFRLTFTETLPLRLEEYEIDVNLGMS